MNIGCIFENCIGGYGEGWNVLMTFFIGILNWEIVHNLIAAVLALGLSALAIRVLRRGVGG